MTLEARIKGAAADAGFMLCGICSTDAPSTQGFYERWVEAGFGEPMDYLRRHILLKSNLESVLPGARSVIAVALNYHQPNPVVKGQPRIAQYALGRDYHKVIPARLRSVVALLEGHENRICVDSAPLLERELAQRAGLGWPGKNTMLINTRRGSWFVLGFILTTARLVPDEPAVGGCGSCRACIDACPTGAIQWWERASQDGEEPMSGRWIVDARLCLSTLTIETKGPLPEGTDLHGWTFGCDICQEVCPFNQERATQPERAPLTQVYDFLNKRTWPSLVELAQLSHEEWDELTRGSPVRRTGHEGLIRNAKAGL